MWMIWLLGFFFFAAPASIEPGFSETYGRNIDIVVVINSVGFRGGPAHD